MSFYRYHVFFCTNQRAGGEMCCNDHGATEMRDHCKARVKALGEAIPGNVRINSAGCMGRCERGPTIVVYPEGTWYTYATKADIDEIVESHLMNGKVVERLKID